MKFFIDTANQEEIREAASLGILDGVTTNPTLLGREMERTKEDPQKILKMICEMVQGPVNAEGMSLDANGIVSESRELSKIAKNITIKVPLTKEGVKAARILSSEGIRVNMTLVFSANQALLAAKAGAAFVSPFIGRLDDAGQTGMDLIRKIVTIYENYDITTEVIVASIRHPVHVVEAALIGADIATIPFAIINKMFRHPLTDVGITRFKEDWEKAEKAGKKE
ncbi:fructose-6-phosphate aldolase [candidate division TA06 bacterium]|uniref:Probable transaldolase n=1 Tax=candidate division TA06 bacterium TaxID=2250710 RepID=A0A523UY51_UNCT6|nr:MAG: fructose-6-phosphate aldolase [candidate division TA06 bacterium]